MIFTDSKIKGKKQEFKPLDKLMKKLGFDRWTWDIHMVVYDKQYYNGEAEYHLRVPGKVINDKQIEHPKALVQLQSPIFSRHFFPHGLDNDVEVPEELREQIEAKLEEVRKAL